MKNRCYSATVSDFQFHDDSSKKLAKFFTMSFQFYFNYFCLFLALPLASVRFLQTAMSPFPKSCFLIAVRKSIYEIIHQIGGFTRAEFKATLPSEL